LVVLAGGMVGGSFVELERSVPVSAPAARVWPLLSGPEAWLLRPDRFAFDVEVPPAIICRVVIGVTGTGPVVTLYEVVEDVPGEVVSLRRPGWPERESPVLRLSAVPDGDGTLVRIAVGFPASRGGPGLAEDYWRQLLPTWADRMREVAEGRMPRPGPGLPDSVRTACIPATPLRRPRSVTLSAVIAAPASEVWEVISAPEPALVTGPPAVCAGVVPGTPARQVGEMHYFISGQRGGKLGSSIAVVTELDWERSALVAGITHPRSETFHFLTPLGQATRLELTGRWRADAAAARTKAYARHVADHLHAYATRCKNRIENPDTGQQ
jgi:hypothetical protein